MDLKHIKGIIRAYVAGLPEDILAFCYAANQDGHMEYSDCTKCLIAHGSGFQYEKVIERFRAPEIAYVALGLTSAHYELWREKGVLYQTKEHAALRRVRLSAILRAEMRRRATDDEPAFTDPAQPDVYTPEEIAHALEA